MGKYIIIAVAAVAIVCFVLIISKGKKKGGSKKEYLEYLRGYCNRLPSDVSSIPDDLEKLSVILRDYGLMYRMFSFDFHGDLSACSSITRLPQDLKNYFTAAKHFADIYEERAEIERVYYPLHIADCYEKGIGTEVNKDRRDYYKAKEIKNFLSYDLTKAYPKGISDKLRMFKDISEEFIKNKYLRPETGNCCEALVRSIREADDRFKTFLLCLLKELIALEGIGIGRAVSDEEAKELNEKAAEEFDLYAIFRKDYRKNSAFSLNHPIIGTIFDPQSKSDRRNDNEKKLSENKKKELVAECTSVNLSDAKKTVMDEIEAYRRPFVDKIRKERMEKEAQEKSGILYREGMKLYSAALTDEEVKLGKEKLKKAAELGSRLAKEAVINIEAEEGEPNAQCLMGELYLYGGEGKKKDKESAFMWFAKSARQKHPKATFYLGQYAQNGWNGPEDPEQAKLLYTRAAEFGDPGGMLYAANMYLENGDSAKAGEYFEKAAYCKIRDDRDRSYASAAAKSLVTLMLPENGRPDGNTRKTFLHAMQYIRLNIEELTKNHVPEGKPNEETVKIASNGDVNAIEKFKMLLGDKNPAIRRALDIELISYIEPDAYSKNDKDIYRRLYELYSPDPRTGSIARNYAYDAIRLGDSKMMVKVWFDSYSLFSESERKRYLYEAANLGNQTAQTEVEYMERMREAEEEKLRMKRERAEREAAELKRNKREWIERDISLMFGGSGYTMEEMMYAGKISYNDYVIYDSVIDKLIK